MTKKAIDKRLSKLEQRIVDDSGHIQGIFYVTVSARKDATLPGDIHGWQYHAHEVLRLPGESDEELKTRAIETVSPTLHKNSVPSFFAIQ